MLMNGIRYLGGNSLSPPTGSCVAGSWFSTRAKLASLLEVSKRPKNMGRLWLIMETARCQLRNAELSPLIRQRASSMMKIKLLNKLRSSNRARKLVNTFSLSCGFFNAFIGKNFMCLCFHRIPEHASSGIKFVIIQ